MQDGAYYTAKVADDFVADFDGSSDFLTIPTEGGGQLVLNKYRITVLSVSGAS